MNAVFEGMLEDANWYYQCPDCGFKQKSQATKRITCHRCNTSYLRRTAKTAKKTPDEEKGTGFFKYSAE